MFDTLITGCHNRLISKAHLMFYQQHVLCQIDGSNR